MAYQQIIPADYPQLRLICWHCDPAQPITPEQAFGIYERNWRYIDPARLSSDEEALINRLKHQYGNGVVNG